MSEEVPSKPTDQDSQEKAGMIRRILHWARSSRVGMAVVGTVGFLLLACAFATWSYLARMAVRREYPVSLNMALYALDVKAYDKAKDVIGEVQRRSDIPQDFGGALFVLGAVKAYQADSEWSIDRQRAMYLMAARYLRKSLALGVPEDRDIQAKYLLGLSLIRGNQPLPGISELLAILDEEGISQSEVHLLLTDAYQALPDPDLRSALKHNKELLKDEALTEEERAIARITQAELLGKLGRIREAIAVLKAVEGIPSQKARMKNISGQLSLQSALRLAPEVPERYDLLDQAIHDLSEAISLEPLDGTLNRQSLYWIGKCQEALGDIEAAIDTFDRIGKQHGDTAESLVATLAQAKLDQLSENPEQALTNYRLVLESIRDPVTYANRLLSLTELRRRLKQAHLRFVEAGQFDYSMALLEQFTPVFDLVEVTALRAKTHAKWGKQLLSETASSNRWRIPEIEKNARYHFRAAGTAYESLARLRFATSNYAEDLWNAAENYYQGHNFSHATRLLKEYLHHEAEINQALALLRLGQSQLAKDEAAEAARTLEECIELHPRDAVVFQARLECFHAYMRTGRHEEARQLLLTNLTGDNLKPKSSEWRASLFALGDYHHDRGDYTEAIKILDEAVQREDDLQDSLTLNSKRTLLARYTIARSFHNASKEPAEVARTAKTESERQKNRKLRDHNLEQALQNYSDVQRLITINGQGDNGDLERILLRNCYMMQGSVLFQLKRYQEARKAYSNISTLYVNEPFVMESFVHIANCWRRLNQPIKAKGTLEQAKLVLQRFPEDTDFQLATNFNREEWKLLLDEMGNW